MVSGKLAVLYDDKGDISHWAFRSDDNKYRHFKLEQDGFDNERKYGEAH